MMVEACASAHRNHKTSKKGGGGKEKQLACNELTPLDVAKSNIKWELNEKKLSNA